MRRILALALFICLFTATLAGAEGLVEAQPVEQPVDEVDIVLGDGEEPGPEAEEELMTNDMAAAGEGGPLELFVVNEAGIPIDAASFPDANFREFVSQIIDTDGDGALSEGERLAVTRIRFDRFGYSDYDPEGNVANEWDAPKEPMRSLAGIGLFENLKVLEGDCCGVTGTLDLRDNIHLEEVLLRANSGLTALDVSGCKDLRSLSCGTSGLKSVRLGSHAVLASLMVDNCALTSLDVSGCPKLERLSCDDNALAGLDVSQNPALSYLGCSGNPGIGSLELGANTALTELWCSDCGLASLDVRACGKLERLICVSNQLTVLGLGAHSGLHMLDARENRLSRLDISRCPLLIKLYKGEMEAIGWGIQGLEYDEGVRIITDGSAGVAVDEVNFPDAVFRAYVSEEFDADRDGFLSGAEIAEAESIDVAEEGIASLAGIEYFTELYSLSCWGNDLTSLDVSRNPKLGYLSCGSNSFTLLDLSQNEKLAKRVREGGPMRGDAWTCFMGIDYWDDTDPFLAVDNDTTVTANGETLCAPGMELVRDVGTIEMGLGEEVDCLQHGWETTPYWIRQLWEQSLTCASSRPGTVRVDGDKITGAKRGKARIRTVAANGIGVTYVVNVMKAPSKVTLSEAKLVLNRYQCKTVKATLPAGTACRKLEWISSDEDIADVWNGEIEASDVPGTVTVTVRTYNGKQARCKVTVLDGYAPEGVRFEKNTLTLGLKEKLQLTPILGEDEAALFTWSSKNKAVAAVNARGLVVGKKRGTTKVIVATHNGKKAAVTVKVVKAPTKVTLNKTSLKLKIHDSQKLAAKLPSGSASAIKWTTGNAKVARVDAQGVVTAVGKGTTTITAKTYNGKKATCKVTVFKAENSVTCRALLVAQAGHKTLGKAFAGSGYRMDDMLAHVQGPNGGEYDANLMQNLSAEGVLDAIDYTFKGADANDVSLFYICTHGNEKGVGDGAGALSMLPSGVLRFGELAEALRAVPGRVIVIVDACGSGAAVYGNASGDRERLEREKRAAEAFNAAAIEAFSAIDPGVYVDAEGNGVDPEQVRANTGELRVANKFYVLTSARYQELGWGNDGLGYCFFTKWLTDGIGTSGRMPADANGNGVTTLNELYSYISSVGDNYRIVAKDGSVNYQHVQVYPAGSEFGMFRR